MVAGGAQRATPCALIAVARAARGRAMNEGHRAERVGLDRRRFILAASGALGALVSTACDSMGPSGARSILDFAERENEGVERLLLRHTSMDVPRTSARAAGPSFP